MLNKEITLKTSAEIASITSDSVKLDVATLSHIKNLKKIIDALTEEKKAFDHAILEKFGHEKGKYENIQIIISDYTVFNEQDFIAVHGEDELKKFKTKPVHKEQVKILV